MASGLTIEGAAATLGISRNTARNRLQVIYSKTETARQSQLAGLLTRIGFVSGDTNGAARTPAACEKPDKAP
jgi:DNA-binding CsgD family transcriptional regulator